MNIEKITDIVKEMLPDKRFNHSLNVAKCALKLATIYNNTRLCKVLNR